MLKKSTFKKTIFASVLALLFVNYANAGQATHNGCEIKKQKIQQQISYAKAHGNTHRVAGLERALQNVEQYCTPESLYQDSKTNLEKHQLEVKERELDLKEAQLKNDAKKIAKREQKLIEAKKELVEAQTEFNALK